MAQAAPFIFQGLSTAVGAFGQFAAGQAQAAAAEESKQIALTQADQLDTQYRDELASTIANIRAIRASTGASPDSPTSRAVIAREEKVSERQRRTAVGSKRLQASQFGRDAQVFRSGAVVSLLGGGLKSLSSFARAF